jgi:hypothetical protein
MIKQGLVLLVNSSSAVTAIAPAGGYLATLPKDATLPSWTYRWISDIPELTLQTPETLTRSRIQIDCVASLRRTLPPQI